MKPILFNTEMVRAILDGRKTVTRRIIKDPYYIDNEMVLPESGYAMHKGINETHGMPYPDRPYEPGDILYVRETWKKVSASEYYYEFGRVVSSDEFFGYRYRADNGVVWDEGEPRNDEFYLSTITEELTWHPSIHMPKEAARIFLRVTDVRVERLRDIDEDGAKAEGVYAGWRLTGRGSCALSARQAFMWLWEYTTRNAAPSDSWALNPWVWVIEFERISKEEAQG